MMSGRRRATPVQMRAGSSSDGMFGGEPFRLVLGTPNVLVGRRRHLARHVGISHRRRFVMRTGVRPRFVTLTITMSLSSNSGPPPITIPSGITLIFRRGPDTRPDIKQKGACSDDRRVERNPRAVIHLRCPPCACSHERHLGIRARLRYQRRSSVGASPPEGVASRTHPPAFYPSGRVSVCGRLCT
jgi:hypothetical protein